MEPDTAAPRRRREPPGALIALLLEALLLTGCAAGAGPRTSEPAPIDDDGRYRFEMTEIGGGDRTVTYPATEQECAAYLASFTDGWQRGEAEAAGSGTLTTMRRDGVRVDVQCAFGTMTVTVSGER